jgi:PAS domain S-box-containing protein
MFFIPINIPHFKVAKHIVLLFVLVCLFPPASGKAAEPKRIVVAGGNSFVPLIFLNSNGNPDGMYVDLWRLWSEKTGVEVEMRLMNWDKTIPALLAGKVDAVDGVTYTPERARFLDFSSSYAELPSYIFFHESIAVVKGLTDLEGFPVGVIGGSHVEDFLRKEASKVRPIRYVNYEEMVKAATQGRLRVFIGEDPMIPFLFAKLGHRIAFRRTEKPIISSDMRMAVRKGDSKILALVERGHKAITFAERQSIRDEWAGVSLASRMPWTWLIWGGVSAFAIVSLILLWNILLQRRIEEATKDLRESEEKYKGLFNSIRDAILVADTDRNIIDFNPAFSSLFGYTIEDLKGKKTAYIYENEEQFKKLGKALEENFDKADFLVTVNYKKKTGEVFPGETGVYYLKDSNDNVIGFIGLIRDITDRILVAETLKREEEKFRVLVEESPFGIAFIDSSGCYKYINPKFIEMFGYSLNDIPTGKDWFKKAYPNQRYRQEVISVWLDDLNEFKVGESRPRTFKVICKNGLEKIVFFKPVTLEDGNQFVICEDVTNQIYLENQLRQAQKMEAIGTLAGGIAHDFNNILGAIIAYTEMSLLDMIDDNPLKNNLNQVLKASDRAKNLVKQILTFSRQSDHEKRPLNIIPIITDSLKLLRASLPSTIEIHQDISKEVENIIGDPTQLQQIMMNLSTNAAHAMQDRGGTLSVKIQSEVIDEDKIYKHSELSNLSSGPHTKLTVSDTGHGMSTEMLERIFDPYYTTKEKGVGTGLGLAIVHGIVKSYNGAIIANTEFGKGSEFILYFPAIDSEETIKTVIGTPLPTGNERILFVDDEKVLVSVGKEMLGRLGYRVVTKTNSIEALDYFKDQPNDFDLVITDVTMPYLTGEKLAQKLLKIRPDIPIILCTGYSEFINEEKSKETGIEGFLMKPIVMKDLAETVRKALDGVDDTS